MKEHQLPTVKISKETLRELNFNTEGNLYIPDIVEYQGKAHQVTKIAKNAFRGCRKLTSISLPETITDIEANAFYRCTRLANIEFRGRKKSQLRTIGEGAICYTHLTEIALPPNVVTLKRYALADNTHLLRVSLPNGLSTIEAFAFSNCPNVESITIPNSVRILGPHVFDGNEGLASVELSCNIHMLAEGTFLDCWSLTEVVLPEGIKHINLKAFDGCANIKHVNIPRTIEKIQGNSWLWQSCQQYFSYNGTKDDWRDMWAMYNDHQLPLHQVIRCTDGNLRNV